MRRLIGYTLFWTAVGILVGLLLPSVVMQWIIMILFFIIGYELFGC